MDSLNVSDEYYIAFNTQIEPGKLVAVKVTISQETLTDMEKALAVNLCEHPLYSDLVAYVDANRK